MAAADIDPAVGGRRSVGGSDRIALQKLGLRLASVAHVCFVLVAVLVVSLVVGVGLVSLYIEQPVVAKVELVFDYREEQPSATITVLGTNKRLVPLGHTTFVSMEMVLPESDYNRDTGVFQISAEAIATTGAVLAKSSQPCMLRFRSLPVRLIRTFVTCIPLLLGFSEETQTLKIPVLAYGEIALQTERIKIQLHPRAGTMGLPQIYSATILLNSRPPWRKEVVRNWRLTFYMWSSLYVYIMMLTVMVTCCRGAVFPASLCSTPAGEELGLWTREGSMWERRMVGESSEGESSASPSRRQDKVPADHASSSSCAVQESPEKMMMMMGFPQFGDEGVGVTLRKETPEKCNAAFFYCRVCEKRGGSSRLDRF